MSHPTMRPALLSRCIQMHQLVRIRPSVVSRAPVSVTSLPQQCRRHLWERKSSTSKVSDSAVEAAIAANRIHAPKGTFKYPSTLLAYYAGRRVVFLGCTKLISSWPFIIVLVSYAPYISDYPILASSPIFGTPIIGPVVLCAVAAIPMVYMYLAAPYITHIHLPLPPFARTSKENMVKFVQKGMPKDTRLKIFTMRALTRPKFVEVPIGELRWTKKRLGCVNMQWSRMDLEKGKMKTTDFFVDERRGAKGASKEACYGLVDYIKRQTIEAEEDQKNLAVAVDESAGAGSEVKKGAVAVSTPGPTNATPKAGKRKKVFK